MGTAVETTPLADFTRVLGGHYAGFVSAFTALAELGVDTRRLSTIAPRLLVVEPAPDVSVWSDRLLAWACLGADRRAIELLGRDCVQPVAAVLASRGVPPGRIETLLHDLRAHLLVGDGGDPALQGYSGRGSLAGFVRTAGVRLWLGERRGDERRAAREEFAAALAPEAIDDPELRFIQASYAEQYRCALHAAWDGLVPSMRLVLRQHLVGGMSIDAIAEFHRIHRSSAARRVVAARDALVEDSKHILAQRLGLSEHDVHSVLRLVRSRLELRLDELT